MRGIGKRMYKETVDSGRRKGRGRSGCLSKADAPSLLGNTDLEKITSKTGKAAQRKRYIKASTDAILQPTTASDRQPCFAVHISGECSRLNSSNTIASDDDQYDTITCLADGCQKTMHTTCAALKLFGKNTCADHTYDTFAETEKNATQRIDDTDNDSPFNHPNKRKCRKKSANLATRTNTNTTRIQQLHTETRAPTTTAARIKHKPTNSASTDDEPYESLTLLDAGFPPYAAIECTGLPQTVDPQHPMLPPLRESETEVMQSPMDKDESPSQANVLCDDNPNNTYPDQANDAVFETHRPTPVFDGAATITMTNSDATVALTLSNTRSQFKQKSKLKMRNTSRIKPYTPGSICDLDLLAFFRSGAAPLVPLTITEECLAALDAHSRNEDDNRKVSEPAYAEHSMRQRSKSKACSSTSKLDEGLTKPITQKSGAWYNAYYSNNTSDTIGDLCNSYIPTDMTKLSTIQVVELRAARERSLNLIYTTIRKNLFVGLSLKSPKAGNILLSHTFDVRNSDAHLPNNAHANDETTYAFLQSLGETNLSSDQKSILLLRHVTRCVIGHQVWPVFLNPATFVCKHIPRPLKDLNILRLDDFEDANSGIFVELIATGLRIYALLYATMRSLRSGRTPTRQSVSVAWTANDFEDVLITECQDNRNFEQAVTTVLSYMLSCTHDSDNPDCSIYGAQVTCSAQNLRTRRLVTHYRMLKSKERTNYILHPKSTKRFTDEHGNIIDFLRTFGEGTSLNEALKRINFGSLPGQWGKPFPMSTMLYRSGLRSDEFDPCLVNDSMTRMMEQRKLLSDAKCLKIYIQNIVASMPRILSDSTMVHINTDTDNIVELRRGLWEAVIAYGKSSLINILTDKKINLHLAQDANRQINDDDCVDAFF
ncbi:hypothetical protein FVE85_8502 [Porphyridium purpureum]|uniref:Uncharacterized protein n=1 Tax=Porphyridium purpureum TaxID=35688 RepID=A0A5J4YFU7_PORPP|nr:hypothetical protein FVE85_8530 [Porphyridium purpureum]KAA8490422.1 hypothetical protein FVE85_1211 [Porphyridium purpureum]KAA8492020.1 hypothetical protein FVE85_8502 [Porphyridium purpureum]|eukprot:POR7703..scf244_28